MSPDLYVAVQLLLLCVFVGGASALLLAAVIGRVRVRRVVMSWQRGRFGGWPLGATAFIAAALALAAFAGAQGSMLQAVVACGYLTGGAFWWGASFLSHTVLVSAYGIILCINREDRTLAWSQVTDYFVAKREGDWHYVFFYRKGGVRERFTVEVPARCRPAFQRVVADRVDARFAFETRRTYDRETLEE